ncbi:MAG: helix-turn-helix domain-containing protein [Flavobacteriales bacterium]|jgi:transcriptional regulator with XRE-family HTH domain|nr:helix-turn-helix domain-containing protein [Flavobacteriales bacterium]
MNAKEIKKHREDMNLTQIEFGERLGVGARSIQYWENGTRSISKNALLLLKQILNEQKHEQQTNTDLTNNHGNKFKELDNGRFLLKVNLIPFSAHASYLETLEQGLEPVEFEEIGFVVERFGKGNYLGFTVKGDSMNGGMLNDTPDGAMVLGRELGKHHWIDGFNSSDYGWIIICEQGIFHKDITHLNKDKGTITCHSRNKSPEYSDFELELNKVKQIFKVIKRTY